METQYDLPKIEQLFKQAGWEFRRLCLGEVQWLSATRHFESAGGGRSAVLCLYPTKEGGLYVQGTYVSAGEDVLAGCPLLVSARELSELETVLSAFLQEALRRIENSWGRRLLRAA